MNLLSVRYSVAIFGLGKEQVKLNNQLTLSIRNIKTVIAVCTTESLNALPAHIVQRQKCFQRSLCCLLQIIHTTDVEFSHPESYATLILSIWQRDLKHADSMKPFDLPVMQTCNRNGSPAAKYGGHVPSCVVAQCQSDEWVHSQTVKKNHRHSCSTALFNCFRGSIMVSWLLICMKFGYANFFFNVHL